MQRTFAEGTDWKMPWLEHVLPNILSITSTHPEKTIFTRFIPARKPGQGVGMWRHYYTVIITGGETDVCVLATVLGAIDWGFRVILVTDAICSSADETHDAIMNVYLNRFGEQTEPRAKKSGPGIFSRGPVLYGARDTSAHVAIHSFPCLEGWDMHDYEFAMEASEGRLPK
jgi:nicotinamidase-related amidase